MPFYPKIKFMLSGLWGNHHRASPLIASSPWTAHRLESLESLTKVVARLQAAPPQTEGGGTGHFRSGMARLG